MQDFKRMCLSIITAAVVFVHIPTVRSDEIQGDGCKPLTAISGRNVFAENCTVCHGADGKGGGPLATALSLMPPDLTTLAARGNGEFPSDHVLSILRNGGGETIDGDKTMPAWAKIFAHECGAAYGQQAILELKTYLETIQDK